MRISSDTDQCKTIKRRKKETEKEKRNSELGTVNIRVFDKALFINVWSYLSLYP